jgi:hypothetical protein
MPHTVLITANVLQNGLLRDQRSCLFYFELLRRLSQEPVRLYMSTLDWDLAVELPRLYGIRGDRASREAFNAIAQMVQRCHIDPEILEHAAEFRPINFCDALRLACASSLNVDFIVTWEPYQFVRTEREYRSFREHGYFDLILPTTMAEADESPVPQRIRVASVESFLSMQFSQVPPPAAQENALFQLEALRLRHTRDYPATVEIRLPSGELVHETAIGVSPVEAIYRAIDRCLDPHVQLPDRHLVYFMVPPTMGGADANTEVRIRVECGGFLFEAIAHNTSLLRAFAEAYLSAVNDMYHCLRTI